MMTAAASLERSEIRQRDREPFVQRFLHAHVTMHRAYYEGLGLRKDVGVGSGLGHADTGQGLESEPLLRDAAALACEMFEALLDKTTRWGWGCLIRPVLFSSFLIGHCSTPKKLLSHPLDLH